MLVVARNDLSWYETTGAYRPHDEGEDGGAVALWAIFFQLSQS